MGTSSLTDARTNFSEILEEIATTGGEWTITRHGRPVAVILGYEEYESLIESLNILSDADTMAAIAEAEGEATPGAEPGPGEWPG